jgi:hypothetical protein
MKPKPKTKNPAPVQLELFTVEPRPMKPASWPTPLGSCSRLRGAVVAVANRHNRSAIPLARAAGPLPQKPLKPSRRGHGLAGSG